MKRILAFLLVLGLAGGVVGFAAEPARPAVSDSTAKNLAKSVTMITGMAISPLLSVGAVGAYDYFTVPSEKKQQLPWYAQLKFWLPALLLIVVVAVKDAWGTVLPPGLKKPLDVAETVENKISGLVAAGAVVPSIAAVFHSASASAFLGHGLAAAGFASVDFTPVLNILSIPFAVAAFVLVWLVAHVINVLILVSPFGPVDAALKAARTAVLGLLVAIHHINPWIGALLSVVIIIIAYFVAGWSFRMLVFGSVFTWDFVTVKRNRFKPAPNANWMFTARKIDQAPVRSYGKLIKTDAGQLTFEYRPWLVAAKRTVTLPAGQYAVGRGLFYPDISLVTGEKLKALLTMPPRYKKHEEEISQVYSINDVRDTGLLKGIKALWRWFTRNLFGRDSQEANAASATA